MSWQTSRIGVVGVDCVRAPDGSEIRPLVEVTRASMVHCRLPAGQVSQAVQHRTVDEVWLCIGGSGQLWRRSIAPRAEIVELQPGVAVSIPLGTGFQFRAGPDQALEVVIATAPPWPGNDEAFPIDGIWTASV